MCSKKGCNHDHANNKNCANCGKLFPLSKKQIKKMKADPDRNFVCSPKCQSEWRVKTYKAFVDDGGKPGLEKIIQEHSCFGCGISFVLSGAQRFNLRQDPEAKLFHDKACLLKHRTNDEVVVNCADPECSKEIVLNKHQKSRHYRGVSELFYCDRTCSANGRLYKQKNNLCSVDGCNNPCELGEDGKQKHAHRLCSYHRDVKNNNDWLERKRNDLRSLFVIEGVLPTWAKNLSSMELSLVREEFVKIYILDICHEHFIRQERETLCGIMADDGRTAVEEDIYLNDINWMLSCKRNGNTTSRPFTDAQLNNSVDFFTKNRRGFVRKNSVAIDNFEDISDMNLLQWSREFKRRILRGHESGRVVLWKGKRAFERDMNEKIAILHESMRLAKNGNWELLYKDKLDNLQNVFEGRVSEIKRKHGQQ